MSLLLVRTQLYAEAKSGWVEREWEVGAWRWGPKSPQEPPRMLAGRLKRVIVGNRKRPSGVANYRRRLFQTPAASEWLFFCRRKGSPGPH